MPYLKTYVVFISHAWRYHDDYERLENLLNNANLFSWRNCSVPKTDAFDKGLTNQQLLRALDEQIRISNVVVMLSGMYAAHSDWMQTEINIAARYGKPIVGVLPWGSDRVPIAVQQSASEIVKWNTQSIVDAIRKVVA